MNRQSKGIILILLILFMCVCLYTVSYAGTEEAQDKTTYNVDIAWGDLTYKYKSKDSRWNPGQKGYVDYGIGVWEEYTPGSSGIIDVKNSSNVDIKLGAAFAVQNLDYYGNITGNFYIKKDSYYIEKGTVLKEKMEAGTVDEPTERRIELQLKGVPNIYLRNMNGLGTVTISIDSEERSAKFLSKNEMTLKYLETDKLTVSNSEDSNIIWSSTNKEIVEVDQEGNVVANGIGIAKVIADVDGEKLECAVTVVSKKGIALSKSGVVLKVKGTDRETDTVELLDATSEAEWTSKDLEVATVTHNEGEDIEGATITAAGKGNTTVIAWLNGEKFCVNVYVIEEKQDDEDEDESEICNHSWNIIETVYPTHFKEGYYILKCRECDKNSYELVEKSEACMFDEEVTKEPTCKDKGVMKLTCKCGYVTDKPIEQVNYMVTYTTENNSVEQVEKFDTFEQVRIFIMTSEMDANLKTIKLENKNNYLPEDDRVDVNTSFESLFLDAVKLQEVDISNFDTAGVGSFYNAFNMCSNLTTVVVGNKMVTSKTIDIAYIFANCKKLTGLNVSNWDTSNVINMAYAFYDCNSLDEIAVSSWNTSKVINMKYMFYGCSGVTTLGVNSWNTSKVTDMSGMFYYCSNITVLDVSNFNTSKVTDMQKMFRYVSKITTLGVSNWNTSQVNDMYSMFLECNNIEELDLSNWNTSNVTNMGNMFYKCTNLRSLKIGGFNTGKVTNMDGMFQQCGSIEELDLSNWNTSSVIDMDNMFHLCSKLSKLNVSKFNTSNVTSMQNMFKECKKLIELDLSSFDTSKVTDMSYMFCWCEKLTTIYASEKFVTTNVTYGTAMFMDSGSLVGNIGYNVGKIDHTYANYTTGYFTKKAVYKLRYTSNSITAPESMYFDEYENSDGDNTNDLKSFIDSNKLTFETVELEGGALSTASTLTSFEDLFKDATELKSIKIDKLKISSCYHAFQGCSKVTSIVFGDDIDTSTAVNMKYMFDGCNSLTVLDVSNLDTSNVTEMKYMFNNCDNLITLDVSNIDTSNVTNMEGMFYSCNNLTTLDVSDFDTGKATNVSKLFGYCKKLTSLNIENLDISNATTISEMFDHCESLKTLDVTHLNVDNAISMYNMFYNCRQLTTLDLSTWNTSKVTNMTNMFNNCNKLTTLNISNFNTDKVTNMSYMFNNCYNLTTLDLSNFSTSNVTSMKYMFYNCNKLVTIYASEKFVTNNVTNSELMFTYATSLEGYSSDNTGHEYANTTTGYFTYKASSN